MKEQTTGLTLWVHIHALKWPGPLALILILDLQYFQRVFETTQ